MGTAAEAILVVGPSWVGDMVMAQSLFIELKKQRPHCDIDVLAPAWSLPILSRMPEVRQGITMPVGHGQIKIGDRYRLARSLRGQYQQAIVLPNSFKSALIPLFARIPMRTGWRGEVRFGLLNDVRKLDHSRLPLMAQRFTALAFDRYHCGEMPVHYPELMVNRENQQRLQSALHLNGETKTLVLCPGAEFGTAKQWPEEHYAAVAEKKISEGWQVWILGSGNDAGTAAAIVEQLSEAAKKKCVDMSGKTALEDTIDIIALADAVICNDSGLMHIAAAIKIPLVVIYGSTSPDFTPPLSRQVKILQSGLECAPCFQRTCPLQHRNCLRQQLPQTVIGELEELVTNDYASVDY